MSVSPKCFHLGDPLKVVIIHNRKKKGLGGEYRKLWVWRHHFPGGPVVKNLPFNAGAVGLIPGRGTKSSDAAEQLSSNYWTCAPH